VKVLLTGVAGYVGSGCLRWLVKHGHEPYAYDNRTEGNVAADPDAQKLLIVGDIAETNRMGFHDWTRRVHSRIW
jgi:UDP-glucose 4-epimerase